MANQNKRPEGKVLLEMNHVKKSFDGSGVLKVISLQVKEGQVVSIIVHLDQENRLFFAVPLFLKRWMQEN